MPFTIQEVVSISEKLRDVTIGLIYMINPDVKTYTSSEMHKPWLYLCQVKIYYCLTVLLEVFHCVKSVCICSYSGPYFSDQNNSEYGHFSRSV